MKRLAGLILLLALVAPGTAAGHRHHRPMSFDYAALVAVDYWTKRGVAVPCHPTYYVLEDADMAVYNARDGVNAYIRASPLRCAVLSTRVEDSYRRDELAWMFCGDIAHEFGHLAGLAHEYGGIMAADANFAPWGCTHRRAFMRHLARHDEMSRRHE